MSDAAETDKGEPKDKQKHKRKAGRKAAEWITIAISSAIVLALAVFLVVQVAEEHTPLVPVQIEPLLQEAGEAQGQYILPVRVRNRGHRTIQSFQGLVIYQTPQGKEERREFTINYLGEQAEQKIYLYLEAHPRDLQVRVRPDSYIID